MRLAWAAIQAGSASALTTRWERRRARGVALLAVGFAITTFLALSASGAHASEASSSAIGSFGSGAGQIDQPTGVALAAASGNVYVADYANDRVDVFGQDGSFLMAFGWGVADGTSKVLQTCTVVCYAGIEGFGKGQEEGGLRHIAVDNDPASAAYEDIFVAERERVQAFMPSGQFLYMIGTKVNKSNGGDLCTAASNNVCGAAEKGRGAGEFSHIDGIAVNLDGMLLVADQHEVIPQNYEESEDSVEEFEASSGQFTSQVDLGNSEHGFMEGLAVAPDGDIYVTNDLLGSADMWSIDKYDESGTLLSSIPVVDCSASTTDAAGNLFAAAQKQITDGGETIFEYGEGGEVLSRFGYSIGSSLTGMAVSSAGYLYVTESGSGDVERFVLPAPAGPIVPPEHPENGSGAGWNPTVEDLGNHRATLVGFLNPEGASTTYHFEYVDQAEFAAHGFSGSGVVTTPEGEPVGPGFETDKAVAALGDLAPETTYHFRIVAKNANGVDIGPEAKFTTLPPLEIDGAWSSNVGVSEAVLHAAVNPLGIATTGAFQYVDETSYRESGFQDAIEVPDVEGGLPALNLGAAEAPQEAQVQLGSLAPDTVYDYRVVARDPFVTVYGPVREFVTLNSQTGVSGNCSNQAYRVGPAAALPDCRAYEMVSPVEKNGTDIVSLININSNPATLDQSALSGEALAYTTSQGFGDAQGTPYVSQYIATRGADGWQSHGITPPQGVSPVVVGRRIDIEFEAFSGDLCTSALYNSSLPPIAPGAVEGYFNVYRRSNCGQEAFEALTTAPPPAGTENSSYTPNVEGISADDECVAFQAAAELTANANVGNNAQLYENCAGGLQLLSVLPSGKANATAASVGTEEAGIPPRAGVVGDAISADGSRVYWTAANTGLGKLYLRENASRQQSRVSGGKCTEAAKACTVTVSAEPAHFWGASSDGAHAFYTAKASGGEALLYEFDLEGSASTQIAGGIVGVLGTGEEEAMRVYFISTEALTGANAQGASPTAGEPNLYLYDATRSGSERYRFVGTLSAADVSPTSDVVTPDNLESFKKVSRVTANGLGVAFMSTASLTGYDNVDAESGKDDAEVYVYDAGEDGGEGRLRCASCNPTGERPHGHAVPLEGLPSQTWAAALLPVYETELYGPRVISGEGGRVFFDSYEALVPRDTNGATDVYEWEEAGVGGCTEESAAYSRLNGGCVSLISSGESPTESTFVDASPDGDDVFFTTASSLVPQDTGLIDIYDARVDGGYPTEPGKPGICEGEACQGAPTTPNDLTPGSLTYVGPGNFKKAQKRTSIRKCTTAKGKTRKGRRGACATRKKKAKRRKRRGRSDRRLRGGHRGGAKLRRYARLSVPESTPAGNLDRTDGRTAR